MLFYKCCYAQSGNRKGVFLLKTLIAFGLSVAAGIVCHYICKWLDSKSKKKRDN